MLKTTILLLMRIIKRINTLDMYVDNKNKSLLYNMVTIRFFFLVIEFHDLGSKFSEGSSSITLNFHFAYVLFVYNNLDMIQTTSKLCKFMCVFKCLKQCRWTPPSITFQCLVYIQNKIIKFTSKCFLNYTVVNIFSYKVIKIKKICVIANLKYNNK